MYMCTINKVLSQGFQKTDRHDWTHYQLYFRVAVKQVGHSALVDVGFEREVFWWDREGDSQHVSRPVLHMSCPVSLLQVLLLAYICNWVNPCSTSGSKLLLLERFSVILVWPNISNFWHSGKLSLCLLAMLFTPYHCCQLWLVDWLIDRLIDRSIDWVIDWLIDCYSARCKMTLNHLKDKVCHDAGKEHLCRHQDQYDNLFYLCKVFSFTCISNEILLAQLAELLPYCLTCNFAHMDLLMNLDHRSNPPFLIFDIRALWRSVLSAREPECQKLIMVG